MKTDTELEHWMRFVKTLRQQNGLSQKEMAAILGIGLYSLRKIERGIFPLNLSLSPILNLYKHFGIKPSDQFSDCVFQDKN